ncbi:hypothetical protein ACNKHU_21960 [Shigella flexneri]
MWVHMMPQRSAKSAELNRFKPMATFTRKTVGRRKKWMWLQGKAQGKGPVGFCRHAPPTKPRCAGRSAPARGRCLPAAMPIRLCADPVGQGWDHPVSASRQKVSYYLTGPGMRNSH